MFTTLSSIAKVNLGYKSLQNDFFYVNKATVLTYGIEKKFLIPMLMLKDMDPCVFEQKSTPSLWLFACKEIRGDLRGTGAWRYIETMADRPAAEKKQSGKKLTIREALEAQSGGLWYAPKAKPSFHHIWLRKAVNTVFSPFLFEKATLVDQRLNSVSPLEGIEWKELAAVLSSSLFAYSLEINGAASMGAGALEAPTTKLRNYPIIDISALNRVARNKLVRLAAAVWSKEQPVDWASDRWKPEKHLRALDEWLLQMAGKSVTVDQMYEDIRDTCRSRILIADDKSKKSKKQESESVGNVASSIVNSVEARLKPETFLMILSCGRN
jgi:hypothetical protein